MLVAADARDLGAVEMTLEVRASNAGAQTFYERMGLRVIGTRPHYYSDREDAVIMSGLLPQARRDVAGMRLHVDDVAGVASAAMSTARHPPTGSARVPPKALLRRMPLRTTRPATP